MTPTHCHQLQIIAFLRKQLCLLLLLASLSPAAISQEIPDHFEPVTSNPVFAAAAGKWDSKIRERGWILRENGLWKLWYTGYQADASPMLMKMGYATSKDGIRWERVGTEPMIDDFWIEDMMVVKKDDTYFMFAEGAQDQAQLLKSADGVQWERVSTLDVRLANGQPIPPGPFGTPVGYFENGKWYLFYERRDLGVWLATSTDMKVWTNVSDEPVIARDADGVDSVMLAMNQVIKTGDEYVAVLHGTTDPMKPRRWCTYLARSRDLMHWKKEAPLRPVEENKSSGELVYDGNQWLLYTMHDRVDLHRPAAPPTAPPAASSR
ncbi:MAG: glycosylase [Planctomycetaceae bacterium]|nr:glycosylase [Planctomycetaceae bacterium]